jgi:hypothetical protein
VLGLRRSLPEVPQERIAEKSGALRKPRVVEDRIAIPGPSRLLQSQTGSSTGRDRLAGMDSYSRRSINGAPL